MSSWFFTSIEATQNIILFWVMPEILLANQFVGFFTFVFCYLLILIPGVHCYIVLVESYMQANHLPTISSSLFGGHKLFQQSSTASNSAISYMFSLSSLKWIVSPSFWSLFSSLSPTSSSSSISSSSTITSSSWSTLLFSYIWISPPFGDLTISFA